jgi:hypothetical protein
VKQDINAILSPRQLSDNQEKPTIDKKGSYNNLNSPLKTHDSLRKTSKNLQSLNPSNYEKLTLTLNEIEVEMATTSTKDNFVNMQGKSILLEEKSAELKGSSNYPIMLITPKVTETPAISVQNALNKIKAQVSFLDLRVCQRSATIISTLIKDVYSCKNLI